MIPIHLRNVPPPPETFDHIEILSFMAKWIKPTSYLELGVRDGSSLWPISEYCEHCCGIDIDLSAIRFPPKDNITLLQTTTDEFFASLEPDNYFDMVFIDADHSHKSSLKDFINASKYIIDDGFIFLHDTYPYSETMIDASINPSLCGECYKTAFYIKTHFIEDFEVITLPFNPGLTMVKKMKRNKQLIYL